MLGEDFIDGVQVRFLVKIFEGTVLMQSHPYSLASKVFESNVA